MPQTCTKARPFGSGSTWGYRAEKVVDLADAETALEKVQRSVGGPNPPGLRYEYGV